LRNSWSELGITEFPLSEFTELPPFWSLFGGIPDTFVWRRLVFECCCNGGCLFICGKGGGGEMTSYTFRARLRAMPPPVRTVFQLEIEKYSSDVGSVQPFFRLCCKKFI
jgi:hypothetical protein